MDFTSVSTKELRVALTPLALNTSLRTTCE